ncbi:MAG: hypothetical protein ACK5LK_01035 [Chthoniobacterales bacterium]
MTEGNYSGTEKELKRVEELLKLRKEIADVERSIEKEKEQKAKEEARKKAGGRLVCSMRGRAM